MSNFGAYVQIKPDNIPFYVGKGKLIRAKRLDANSHNIYHSRVIKKYGKDNIDIAFIECSSEEIAFKLEIGLIKCINRMGIPLTNLTLGGEGVSGRKLSPEHKLKLSDALTGRVGTWLGRNHSEETKEKLRILKIGNTNRKGKLASEVTKIKQSKAMLKHWEKPNSKEKQRDAACLQMKQIITCGVTFKSIHEYCNYVDRPLSTVSRWYNKNWQDKIDAAYLKALENSHAT